MERALRRGFGATGSKATSRQKAKSTGTKKSEEKLAPTRRLRSGVKRVEIPKIKKNPICTEIP
jgi:hypothetical protein